MGSTEIQHKGTCVEEQISSDDIAREVGEKLQSVTILSPEKLGKEEHYIAITNRRSTERVASTAKANIKSTEALTSPGNDGICIGITCNTKKEKKYNSMMHTERMWTSLPLINSQLRYSRSLCRSKLITKTTGYIFTRLLQTKSLS